MKKTVTNAGGRPSKLTPELQLKICEDVASGVPITKAFVCNGVHFTTGYDWKRDNPDFAEALAKADAAWEAHCLARMYRETDWKAQATLLKMRRPEYRDRAVDIKVEANANASAQAIPKETLAEIQRLRRVVTTGGNN